MKNNCYDMHFQIKVPSITQGSKGRKKASLEESSLLQHKLTHLSVARIQVWVEKSTIWNEPFCPKRQVKRGASTRCRRLVAHCRLGAWQDECEPSQGTCWNHQGTHLLRNWPEATMAETKNKERPHTRRCHFQLFSPSPLLFIRWLLPPPAVLLVFHFL